MSARLIHLSKAAHAQAMSRGTSTPAERQEFLHLPMRMVVGVPVFDPARMRPDQVEETEARLESITGRAFTANVRDQVKMYMAAFGRQGLRVQDVCDALGADKKGVLKYLRELEAAGQVRITEEKTRGNGSLRKRYWSTESELDMSVGPADFEELNLSKPTDSWFGIVSDGGIIYHGTSSGAFMGCGCSACAGALEAGLLEEERSTARRSGGTGFMVGLKLRRIRRERAEAEDARLLRVGLAARNG